MAEAPTIEEAGPSEPKKGGLLPLLAVLLVTLGGGALAGQTVLGPKLGQALASRASKPEEPAEGQAAALHVVDNLVVNPAGSGGSRFLLTTVAVEASTPEGVARLAAKDMEIRDAFTLVLGARTVDMLTDVSQREALSRELLAAVEAVMGPGTVRRVLIPQFVVQ